MDPHGEGERCVISCELDSITLATSFHLELGQPALLAS